MLGVLAYIGGRVALSGLCPACLPTIYASFIQPVFTEHFLSARPWASSGFGMVKAHILSALWTVKKKKPTLQEETKAWRGEGT